MRTPLALLLAAACSPQTAEPDALSMDDAPTAESLGWTEAPSDTPLPPPVAPLDLEHAAMVGAPIELMVSGIPSGTTVKLMASYAGLGAGPCHPSGLCVDILSPRVVGSRSANANGVVRFQVNPPAPGWVAFQGVIPGVGTTNALPVSVAEVDAFWSYDQIEVTVDHGETGYYFGMAETDSGYGWYGEDCVTGYYCHPMTDVLLLDSVHPAVGGPGINYVADGVTTLFYAYHDAALTYYLEGMDSGDCWTWGHDPTYYPDCVEL